MPRAARRTQILELAGALFAERGYQKASMSELARRAGVTKPVIYDLVGSKEELFRLCAQGATDVLAQVVAKSSRGHDDDFEAGLRASAAAAFRFLAKQRRLAPVMFPDALGDTGDLLSPFRHAQVDLFERGLRAHLARRGVDADDRLIEIAANAFAGTAEALVRWWTRNPDVKAETLARWLVTLTMPGLDALLSSESAPKRPRRMRSSEHPDQRRR